MSSRTRYTPVLGVAAALLTACAATPTGTSLVGSNAPFFIGSNRAVTVDREYLHRYACADGAMLECRCISPRFGRCDCSC